MGVSEKVVSLMRRKIGKETLNAIKEYSADILAKHHYMIKLKRKAMQMLRQHSIYQSKRA